MEASGRIEECMRKWKVIAMAIAGAALLFGATVINGDRSIVGRWDASNSTGTLPFQVGTAASLPATCTVGQIYFASDGINGRQIQKCAAANTWSAIVYDQGTVLPAACALGQIYFKTDATAGQNLYYCTGTNAWTQQLNSRRWRRNGQCRGWKRNLVPVGNGVVLAGR